jgi:hypothetical protein
VTFGFPRSSASSARMLEQRLRVLTTFDAVGGRVGGLAGGTGRLSRWALRDPKAAYPADDLAV